MDLQKQLIALAKSMKVRFTLNNSPLSYEDVFSDTGMLSGLARRADQLCSLCLGYGIGATFDEAEGTRMGVKVKFDEVTPNILRLLCICDVISELAANAATKETTPLDELMYD